MGDPTLLGWTTTILYFLATYFSYQVWKGMALRSSRSSRPSSDQRGWAITTAVMLVLGFNKQLDLQTTLREVGIRVVHYFGLYAYQWKFQVAVFLAAAVVALSVGLVSLPIFVHAGKQLRLALLGVSLVALYVVLRAALFQHLSSHLGSPAIQWLEPLGVSLSLVAALSMRRMGHQRLHRS